MENPKDSFEDVRSELKNCIYLEDSSVEIFGYKIYGSPWQNPHCWNAFQREEKVLIEYWKRIPEDTDILLTHSPPKGYRDYIPRKKLSVGSQPLMEEVTERVKPIYHVFGHIHEAYGVAVEEGGTTFVNAAICDEKYKPIHLPFVFDLPINR